MLRSLARGVEKRSNVVPESPVMVGGKRHVFFPSTRELLGPSGHRIMGKSKLGAVPSYYPAHHPQEIQPLRINKRCV